NATTARTPNTAKVHAPPKELSIDRKTAATIAFATRSEVSIADEPIERSRDGKLSPAYTHTSAPKPNVKPTVNSSTPRKPMTVSAPPNPEPAEKTPIRTTFAAINAATWTSAGSTRSAKLPLKPIASNSRGL